MNARIQAGIDKHFEEEEKENLIKQNLINSIWHRDHPIKLQLRKIIQATPREIIEKRFPGWTEAQIINFHYSGGDINMGPDDPDLISIEEAGSLPSAFYETFFPPLQIHQPAQPQPVQAHQLDQRLIGPNPFGRLFRQDEKPPDPTRPTTTTEGQTTSGPPEPDRRLNQGPGDPRPGTSSATGTSHDLDRIRPELRTANFERAKYFGNLNAEEDAYFQRTFHLQLKLEELQRNEGNRKSVFRKSKDKS